MKHHLFRKLTAAACALALSLSLLPAAQAAAVPAKSSNINKQDYTTYGSTVKSYLYENEDGGLTRVEYISGKIIVEDYDSDFTLQDSRTVPMELSIWGGFYAGEDCNFLMFGQNNPGENDDTEVIRVVKYSKDWQRLGQASLRGANTTVPFEAGSLRCDEYGGYLYIRTCHKMYQSDDGLNHQSNLTMAVRQSDMTITDSYYDVFNSTYGYVSHSFNQFLIVDKDGYIVALDHGDAYPRGVVHTRYYSKAGTGRFTGQTYGRWCSCGSIMDFAGSVGNNTTGASIGGLAETGGYYIMAYNYDGTAGRGDRYPYYHFMDKATGKSWSVKLTNTPGATTPVLAPTGLNGGYMLWNGKSGYTVDDTLYYITYGADGQPGENIQTAEGSLSDCQPIAYHGKVVWYVTDNSAPTFYTLDSTGVKSYSTGGGQSSTTTTPTTPATPAAPATPTTPTTPATPTKPATPSTPSGQFSGILSDSNQNFTAEMAILKDGTLMQWWKWETIQGKIGEVNNTLAKVGSGYRSVERGDYLLKEDGTLWFQEATDSTFPAEKILDNVKQYSNGVALKNDGTVWSLIPLEKPPYQYYKDFFYITDNAKQVFGHNDNYAEGVGFVLKNDGTLWSWGATGYYQLGRTASGGWTGLGKVMDNVAYVTDGMAIRNDGTLWSWGANDHGTTGNGSTGVTPIPVRIMSGVAGAWSFKNGDIRFALTKDGSLYSWGDNFGSWGALGYRGGNKSYTSTNPYFAYTEYWQDVPRKLDIDNVISVYSDGSSTVFQKRDGSLWAIGENVGFPGVPNTSDDTRIIETPVKFLDGVRLPAGLAGTSTSASAGTTPTAPTTPTTPATPTAPTNTNPFTDVPEGTYYHDAVLWALKNNITTGVTATQFQPNATCTRGQVVTFLWRAKGCPEPTTKVNPFRDVSTSSPFYKAILWAYENNITTGTTATTFNPSGTCTSGHVVTFLWRANGKPAASAPSMLAQMLPGKYYTDAVAWAETKGLLSNVSFAFVPGMNAPRADIVTYLYRDLAA